MNRRRRWLQAAAGACVGAGPAAHAFAAAASGDAFAFALIGDTAYSETDAVRLSTLLSELDAQTLRFVLHVGDIKGGRESCEDALLQRRRDLLDRSAHPLVVLPGDNDWTDCHRHRAGGFDPLERLVALRRLFWASPAALGGERGGGLTLERQPGLPENVRWRIGPVQFVGLHVVGSGNGLEGYPGSRGEFRRRRDANRVWLSQTVGMALETNADALAIAFHADPDFHRSPRPGFADFVALLQESADRFRRPILLMHGDSHRFRADRPLADRDGRRFEHVQRVICFGWPSVTAWVRIAYLPADPLRFRVGIHDRGAPGTDVLVARR